jgi:ABC-2 type transport system permease protein
VVDLRPYAALFRGQARSLASYRASFVLELSTNVFATVMDVVTVLVLFRVSRTLGGFTLHETLLVVGLSACAFATADLVMDLPLRKLSRCLFGAGVLAFAAATAGIDWTPGRVALVVVAPLAGVVFFSAIFVVSAAVAFWWVETGEVGNAFTYGGRDFTSYPITVYSGWFRRLFAYGMGFAFVSYYPALALLGRTDPLGLPAWVGYAAPSVAVVAAAAATVVWRIGIRHYRSTGS